MTNYRVVDNKLYNEAGNVGFIVSPQYGCGWYSANGDECPDCATDATAVMLVLEYRSVYDEQRKITFSSYKINKDPNVKPKLEAIQKYMNKKYPNNYWDAEGLEVKWGPPGAMVRFSEYDGSESYIMQLPDSDTLVL